MAAVLLCVGRFGASTGCGAASGNLPSARKIMARHARAVGGSAIYQRKAYHYTGGFELPGNAKGTLEMFGKQPHKLWLKVTTPNGGKYLRVTDGETMWHFNPQQGLSHARELGVSGSPGIEAR
jgi:hypothetical protein